MNNLIDQIDAYLDGTMNATDRAAFETKMNNDASLRGQVNDQQNLRAGIDRIGIKTATTSAFSKITLKNKIYKWGLATVVTAAIVTAGYLALNNSSSSNEDNPEITYELPATNEEGGTQWADADRNLQTQLFTINPAKDTVIETMGGIVFAIPAGAFVDAKDPMTFEVREAITPFDIMKAGLSTTSNGELLETGGMFYINARNGEKSLQLNPDKPICANVPTDEIRPGMQLFTGERMDDGSINWVNPKPLEKQLIPVDIFSLNFYPPGFLEKVAELGFDANDRKVTDSIYYSYAGRLTETFIERNYEEEMGPKDSLLIRFLLISHKGAKDAAPQINRSRAEADQLSDNIFNMSNGGAEFSEVILKYSDALIGGEFWLHRSSREYPELIDFVLSDGMWSMKRFYTEKGWYIVENLTYKQAASKIMEIDPARIAAIRTVEFQNTILATKEFEKRVHYLWSFVDCNCAADILDVYVNNVDKKLYEIDSIVLATIPCCENDGNFSYWLSLREGGISIGSTHKKELQEYYQKKQEAVRIASQKMYESRTAEQRKQDSAYFADRNKQNIKNAEQTGLNIMAEFSSNLKDAYRQLGLPMYVAPPPTASYTFDVPAVGWHNVDKYVYESVVDRTTLDYTDPMYGKKAVIKYEELKINIADAGNYGQLMVYLVTDSLPCFQKIQPKDGAYVENLNERFEYSLVIMAEKDGTWFSATTPNVTPGSVNVTLKSTDESSLRNEMDAMFSGKVGDDFGAEISYMKETRSFNVRKEKEAEQARIDREIMMAIFPCSYDISPAVYDPNFNAESWAP